MKTHGLAKVLVLNPDLASKITFDRISNNFQREAANGSGVLINIDVDLKNDHLMRKKFYDYFLSFSESRSIIAHGFGRNFVQGSVIDL